MKKLILKEKEFRKNQGSWWGECVDENGVIIGQTWRDSEAGIDAWYAELLRDADLDEGVTAPPTIEDLTNEEGITSPPTIEDLTNDEGITSPPTFIEDLTNDDTTESETPPPVHSRGKRKR